MDQDTLRVVQIHCKYSTGDASVPGIDRGAGCEMFGLLDFLRAKPKRNESETNIPREPNEVFGIERYAFDGPDVATDIREKFPLSGDLVDIYATGSAQLVHKWHHYIPLYERYFRAWRGTTVRFLEIGVSKGGSLSMWRRYFGPEAVIFGIDIDEACRQYDGIDGQVRIGSQDDRLFLKQVIAEMGGVDIILDDGSHIMRHVRETLEIAFPLLSSGGVYMIEDLHTAYWPNFGGGIDAKENFFNYVRELMDDVHAWYHEGPKHHSLISDFCTGVHLHDSVCVFEKGRVQKPTHSQIMPGNSVAQICR